MLTFGRNIIFSLILHIIVVASVFVAGRNFVAKNENFIMVSFIEKLVYSEKAGELKESPANKMVRYEQNMQQSEISGKDNVEASTVLRNTVTKKVNHMSSESMNRFEDNSDSTRQVIQTDRRDSSAGNAGIAKPANILIPNNAIASEIISSTRYPGVPNIGKNNGTRSANENSRQIIHDLIQDNLVYPFLAVKNKMEGTVITEFSVNSKGKPKNIKIIKSSGFNILDYAAKNTIIKAAPFPVVKGDIEVPITFRLRRNN